MERELADHDTWPEIPVFADERDNFLVRDLSGTVRVDIDGQRLGNTDGIRELDKDTTSDAREHQRLGYSKVSEDVNDSSS